MSRSNYSDECEYLDLYRANVERAIKGKRGQAFLAEMADALDAMTEKKLITDELMDDSGSVCAIGSICKQRGLDIAKIDYYDPGQVAKALGISTPLAAEIEFLNDEEFSSHSPEQRWERMRYWVQSNLSNDRSTRP
jgi:hypothetical protein